MLAENLKMWLSFCLKRAQIFLCLGAFLLTILGGWLFSTPAISADRTITESPPLEISQGWEYRWGDSPFDENYIPTWTYQDASNLAWKPLKIPTNLAKPPGEKFIWFRVKLPAGQWKHPSLYLKGFPLELYLNKELVDTFATLTVSGDADYRSAEWPIFALEPDFAGKTLFFRFPIKFTDSLQINTTILVLGSQSDLVKKWVRRNIAEFVLGCFFICIGLFIIFISIRRQIRESYFSFCFLTLCIGLFTVSQSGISFLLVNNLKFWVWLLCTSFLLFPISICIFFEQIFGAGYQSIIRHLGRLHLIYAIVALILAVINFKLMNKLINIESYLFLITILTTMITALIAALKGNVEARLFTAGFFIFGLGGLHDVLISILGIFHQEITLYYWGMLIFIFFVALILERRFVIARKRLQKYSKELEAKNATLQRLNQLKDEFLANTSHELRTPLNGIIGIAESMMDGATGQLTSLQVTNLSMIASSGRRLAHLVNDILDFSKLKHKNIQLQMSPVDMRAIADVVLALCRPLIGNKPLQLSNLISPEIPAVEADENRVQQIMHNLIGNAIKFTDIGVVEVSARVTHRPDSSMGTHLEVTVSDTGIGIPTDKLDRIFESFEQADGSTSREYGGTGLGLAITKQLVELHGGEIRAESAVGSGSRFTFTLPLSQEQRSRTQPIRPILEPSAEDDQQFEEDCIPIQTIHPPDPALMVRQLNNLDDLRVREQQRETRTEKYPIPLNPQPTTDHPQNGYFKILIVDDEPVNLQVLVNHLSLQNYAIAQASNGLDALETMEKGFQPDLILLDVMMPRMTGYEVCQKIREQFPAHELPIVFLTAKNQVADLVEGLSYGGNDYLTKPVSKNELLARIKTHIQLSKINLSYSRFVPREFLQFLKRESIVDVQLGDQVQEEMTILFSDIRSFTSLSETMSPKENFNFLNSYLSRVGPVIRNHNGFIDKYIGDAIMALFPQTAEDAVKAAIEMQKQVAVYNLQRQKYNYPSIAIGIGLHTGSLMLGTIGEEKRMESTVIADAVNLASRMEGLTKLYGAGIVITEQTLSRLDEPCKYNCRFLDRVKVKGKKAAVAVFELYDGDPEVTIDLKTQTCSQFEQGVYFYHQQKFSQAYQIFQELREINQQDKAILLYLKRCETIAKYGTSEEWNRLEMFNAQL